MKPIDKSKKSNRRCWNCAHYGYANGDKYLNVFCMLTGKSKEYWNCCKNFEWNPEKEYKEALKDGKGDKVD